MSRFIDRLRRPTADNTANTFMNQVVGNKSDAVADGAVTATDTLVAYIKQIVTHVLAEADVEAKIDVIDGYHDVATADAVTNAVMSDVIGNKTDAAAEDAVSEVETLMAYIKQTITLAIARDIAIGIVDGLHDVPTADAVTNLYMRDVIGIKTDTAAEDAVSEVESLMAYLKQLVTLAIARDTAIGVVDGLHDVPVADAATNLYMRDVVGIKTDTAATGAVSAVESLMAYIKQLVTATIVDATQNTVGEVTGDADIDISEAVYTGYINILTVIAPATGLASCRIDIDANKEITGWDTISTAADTIDIVLVGQFDGTNYRTIENATQIAANGDGSLENNESGVSFNIGPLGPNESLQIHVKLSAERDDVELPYRVTYVGAAPTVTPVAAA